METGNNQSVDDIVFVLPHKTDAEIEKLETLDVDRDWQYFNKGVNSWILQTCLRLRAVGYAVTLSAGFRQGAVNIAHVADLTTVQKPTGCFIVGVRADYPQVRWCNAHIVQNKSQLKKKSVWIPHWPQPGLQPRDQARGSRVHRVAYFGLSVNHYSRVFNRASGFFRVRSKIDGICRKLGLELIERGPDCWNDFHDIDVVLGYRSFGPRPFNSKPPTKLINAWLAGAPFVGGADSAYTQIGSAENDFIRAVTPDQLEKSLRLLLLDEAFRDHLQKAAAEKAAIYTVGNVCKRWVNVLQTLRSYYACADRT